MRELDDPPAAPQGRATTRLTCLLVDPSLFTPPYDAALADGLAANGVRPVWAVRPLRDGEAAMLPAAATLPLFYRRDAATAKGAGSARKALKALSHLSGALGVLRLGWSGGIDVVHFQWAVLPAVDALVMRALALRVPVILTVHDTNPFNGNPTSRWQRIGFGATMRAASRIIVHTEEARGVLLAGGLDADRVCRIPHGPLSIPGLDRVGRSPPGKRPWVFVLFGKLQPYKGADVLVEAVASLPPGTRAHCRFIVAGEALMPVEPLRERIRRLGVEEAIDLRLGRLGDADMLALFAEADCFVFPYRAIEASGVLSLVGGLGKWIVASDLGSFRHAIRDGENGALVPAGDHRRLAAALAAAIGAVPAASGAPAVPGWHEIGLRTRRLYEAALAERSKRSRAGASVPRP